MSENSSTIQGRGAQINTPDPYSPHIPDDSVYFEDDFKEKLNTSYIPVYPKTIINKVKSPDVPMEYSMNPYQGCEHGCVYCYARNTHPYWGYSAGLDFESKILIKQNVIEILKKTICKKNWKVAPIVLSGNTDCYQPIESKEKITRSVLDVLNKYKHPVGIITKNAMILRDLDLLSSLAKDNLIIVNISISGTDESQRRFLEPRTSSYKKRFEAVRKLSDAGVPVRVLAGPLIPGFNNHTIHDLVKLSADYGAFDVSHLVVRLNGDLPTIFADWAGKQYPDRAKKMLSQIAELHGGKLSDSRFNIRAKGQGKWAEIIRKQYQVAFNKYFPNGKQEVILDTSLFAKNKPGQLSLF